MSTDTAHAPIGNKFFYWVWSWLLLLTVVEVVLAYQHLGVLLMIVILLGLSLIKSALIVAYFMHMRFERLSVFLTLVPAVIGLICLMFISFPDSLRVIQLAPK